MKEEKMNQVVAIKIGESQLPSARKFNLWGWIICVGVFPWLFWHEGIITSISWPILFSVLSIPAGWYLGYRRLIGPLFMDVILTEKRRHNFSSAGEGDGR